MRFVLGLAAAMVSLLPLSAQISRAGREAAPPTPVYKVGDMSQTLGLTTDQIESLNGVTVKAKEEFDKAVEQLGALDDVERERRMAELALKFKDTWNKGAREFLTDNQVTRNRQLDIQVGGFSAFLSPDVQRQLNLSDDQLAVLRGQVDWSKDQLAAIKAVGDKDAVKGGKMYADYLIDRQRRMDQYLTPGQRRDWVKMIGTPYTLKPGFYGR